MAELKTPLAKNSEEIFDQLRGMSANELQEEAEAIEKILDSCTPTNHIWRSGIYDELELRAEFIEELL